MPIYEFECGKCGNFDLFLKKPKKTHPCPKCKCRAKRAWSSVQMRTDILPSCSPEGHEYLYSKIGNKTVRFTVKE